MTPNDTHHHHHDHDHTGGGGGPSLTRRQVLKLGGLASAMALFASCTRAPAQFAIPFLVQPEEMRPGVATWYATTCHACPAQCGVMAKVRDGRPIKLEGTPEHPLNAGGLCAIGQAQVRSLYDSGRLRTPYVGGQKSTWQAVDEQIKAALAMLRDGNKPIALVTSALTGPTDRAVVADFLRDYPTAAHIVHDAPSQAAIRDAHRLTHGTAKVPNYRFDKAKLIVGIEADFLGTWLMPVAFATQYAKSRNPENVAGFSRHVQFESRLSLTGSNADTRLTVAPSQLRALVAHLAHRVAELLGVASPWQSAPPTSVPNEALRSVAGELVAAKGHSLVVCGVNDVAAQVMINAINHLLGNYAEAGTLEWHRPLNLAQGDDAGMSALIADIDAGTIGGVIFWNVNPVYDHPAGQKLASALPKLALSVAMTTHMDETASAAKIALPIPHALEAWGDGQPRADLVTITQPTVQPLFKSRPAGESIARWLGGTATQYERIRDHWRQFVFRAAHPNGIAGDWAFDDWWTKVLHRGFATLPTPAAEAFTFDTSAIPALDAVKETTSDGFELALHLSPVIGNGAHTNNPWLLECPEPISKVTWDNYAALHPATAAQLGVKEGQKIRISVAAEAGAEAIAFELPVVPLPGTHRKTIAIALGFGRTACGQFENGVGEFGTGVGQNAAPLQRLRDRFVTGHGIAATVAVAGGAVAMAKTQSFDYETVPFTGQDRMLVREANLSAFAKNPKAGNPPSHHPVTTIWPEHKYPDKKWAISIDLTKCIGCSGCLMACQAENNIPVVGKSEIVLHREMHWLRIDRYYRGDDDTPRVGFLPMMCQQCDNAPCETVCPVLATTHSSEGLNDQTYNRCVGTRYCANNCPYKVRRFNWFEYHHDDDIAKLALNPDVTVRSRGVMEKCSFCVQRIFEVKAQAKREGRDIRDGEIMPACAQSCPTQAIRFGDENDKASTVSTDLANPRAYHQLVEVNTRPSVAYLTRIRNRNETEAGPAAEVTGHE